MENDEGRGSTFGKSRIEDRRWKIEKPPSILYLPSSRTEGLYELRKKENLGRSDTPLILQRKIWIRELQALADGAPLTQWNRPVSLQQLISYSHVPVESQAKD